MTVRDLIKRLELFDQDATVLIAYESTSDTILAVVKEDDKRMKEYGAVLIIGNA